MDGLFVLGGEEMERAARDRMLLTWAKKENNKQLPDSFEISIWGHYAGLPHRRMTG